MTIVYKKKTAVLSDLVSVDEAEGLLAWLIKNPKGTLNLAACNHVHAACLQVLMAANAPISAWPRDTDLAVWLKSMRERNGEN